MRFSFGLQGEGFKLSILNTRVFDPDSIETMPRTLRLNAARCGSAAFQVLLVSDADFTLNTAAQYALTQRWTRPVLRIAADGGCAVHIEGMHRDDNRILRADSLLSDTAAAVSAGQPVALWVEKEIPADAEPGETTVTVRFFLSDRDADEVPAGEASAVIRVWPCTLPSPHEQRFYLDLWQHSSILARTHETPLWSDAHFAVLEQYVRTLGELGQRAVTLVCSEIPWRGQSCAYEYLDSANLFEYSIVRVTRSRGGVFSYDYSAMDRYIALCERYGIDAEYSLYGLCGVWTEKGEPQLIPGYPDNIRIRYLDEADGCMKFVRNAADADAYIAALERHFFETGRIGRVRVAADEPSDPVKYRRALDHLAEIAPHFRFKAAINHAEFIPEFGHEVYDFAPFINCLCREYEKLREYKATMPGKRFLWYLCCGPDFPNTFLRSPLAESWLVGVLTSYAGMDGFLRWDYNVYPDDPRESVSYSEFPAGDVNFVYPSKNGAPLLTLRWKALRRGIRFYELLERLREKDADDYETACRMVLRTDDPAQFAVRPMARDALYSTDPADYEALMAFLLEKLS